MAHTETINRICGDCVEGTDYSAAVNAESCTAVTPACDENATQTTAPTLTADRVCDCNEGYAGDGFMLTTHRRGRLLQSTMAEDDRTDCKGESTRVYSRLYEAGLTEGSGLNPNALIKAEIGYGPVLLTLAEESGWTWFAAAVI